MITKNKESRENDLVLKLKVKKDLYATCEYVHFTSMWPCSPQKKFLANYMTVEFDKKCTYKVYKYLVPNNKQNTSLERNERETEENKTNTQIMGTWLTHHQLSNQLTPLKGSFLPGI